MKKFLSLVLALVMTMSLVTVSAGAKDFTDSDKITYEEAVAVMSEIGVIDGYTTGDFKPTATLTRGAAAKIICNMILGPTTANALAATTAPFSDVPADSTFAGYIAYCQKTGIIGGYADGTFKPGNSLTGYAFLKMLLGALGYDAAIEGYASSNWSVTVAKQAIEAGLTAGLTSAFDGTKAVTREEACLYAFNTLKAIMVEYDNRIVVGEGSTAVAISGVRKDLSWNKGTKNDGNIEADGYVQFAEQYFPKLSVKVDADDFGRPANLWTNNSKKIGSYVDWTKLVGEYTTAIDGKDLYTLLSSTTIKNYTTTYYVDGRETKDVIKTSNMIKTNTDDYDTTGNGVLTQVFVDDDAKEITITSINTYLAKVLADYNTKTETLSVDVYSDVITDSAVKLDDVAGIEEYEEDDMILVQAAWNGKTYEIVDVMDVDVSEDLTLTKYKQNSYVVSGGEQTDYAFSAKQDGALNELGAYNTDMLKDYTWTVYVDQYGYLIGIKKYSGELHYLFLTGYDRDGSYISNNYATANVIFLDGSMETVSVKVDDTNKNIVKAAQSTYVEIGEGEAQYNKWFSYKTSEKKGETVYTLTPAEYYLEMADVDMKINSANVRLTQGSKRAYGNDDSVYIVVETGKVDLGYKKGITKVTGTYTGVQDVDMKTVASDLNWSTTIFALYDEDLYIIGTIVIGEDINSNTNYAYAYKATQNEYVDADGNTYWDFKAIVDGKTTTLTVKEEYEDTLNDTEDIKAAISAQNGDMFKLTYDKDGYVVDAERCVDSLKYVYGETEWGTNIDTDDHKIYNNKFFTDRELYVVGRTLYVDKTDTNDVGLTVVADAPIIVIQDEVKSDGKTLTTTVNEYSSIKQALNSLKDYTKFNGYIAAVLNSKGTAEYLVINSTDAIGVVTDDGSTPVVNTGVTGIKTWQMTTGKLGVQLTGAKKDTKAVVEVTMSIGATVKEMSYTVTVDDKGEAALPITVATGTSYMVTYGDFVATLNA